MSNRCLGLTHVEAHFLLFQNGYHVVGLRLTTSVVFIEYKRKDSVIILMLSMDLVVREVVED